MDILFFLIVSLSISKKKFENLTKESKTEITNTISEDQKAVKRTLNKKEIDSIKNEVIKEIDASIIPFPEVAKKQILKEIEKEVKDTTSIKISGGNRISFGGDTKLDKFIQYQKNIRILK